jgi:hypothetical protein
MREGGEPRHFLEQSRSLSQNIETHKQQAKSLSVHHRRFVVALNMNHLITSRNHTYIQIVSVHG